jgi:hypothetical protein
LLKEAYLALKEVDPECRVLNGGLANGFGLTLLPMLVGVGILFFNGRSIFGWVLTLGGIGFILLGILMNMDIYFRPTSLWNTILMLVLIAGGLGFIFRSLRPHGNRSSKPAAGDDGS